MSRTLTDQVGVARYPSPRLWKDCRHGLLNDLGLGFYQHSEFNGGFQSTSLTAAVNPTLPDPTDAPANVDTLRDDLDAVWQPFVENAFLAYGITLALTTLTDGLADTASLLTAELNVMNGEIEAAFLLAGEVVSLTDFAGATADAIREEFVATQNGEIEAAFATIAANDEYSMDDFEMDFDVEARLSAKTGELGGWIDVETGPADNNAFAFFLRPFGEVQIRSGKKMWFEVSFEVGAVADQGVFIGWAEEAALSRDVLADGAAATIGESYCGFRILSGDTDGLDSAYKLDAGTEVEPLADVTNGNALPAADRASIVAATPHKVGMRFDGRETMEVFVDGVRVTIFQVTSAFPTNVDFGFIVAVKTGTAARQSIALDWARVAYEEVH